MPTLHYTLTRDDAEIELEVEYTVADYHAATGPSWNDPGSPAEGGEIEELTITHDGEPFALTDAEELKLEEHIYETHDYSEDDFDF